jgi:heterodisulfide reductase subunit B
MDTQHKVETRDGMVVEWEAPIAMDDGIVLRADVFRPVKDGKYPAILSYGPYGKGLAFQDGYKTAWEIMCRENPDKLKDINRLLTKLGLEFNNTIKTQHLLEVLHEHNDKVLTAAKKQLPLRAAVMNPCQVFRPAAIMQFDDSEHPRIMEKLVCAVTEADIPYSLQDHCCGASLTVSNLEAAYQIGRARLNELKHKDTEVIITACGNCHLLLDHNQSAYFNGPKIPCLFLPQLLGLAMGMTPGELMINDLNMRSLLSNV